MLLQSWFSHSFCNIDSVAYSGCVMEAEPAWVLQELRSLLQELDLTQAWEQSGRDGLPRR